MSYYRGLKYLGLKKKHGGFDNVKSKGQSELSTSEGLAQEFKVSENTINRDAKFAEGLEIVSNSNPKLRNYILLGEVKMKNNDIVVLTQSNDRGLLKFKNAADLYNKINTIKNGIFQGVEANLDYIDK